MRMYKYTYSTGTVQTNQECFVAFEKQKRNTEEKKNTLHTYIHIP